MSQRVWPRSDKRHLSPYDVHELWQFVNACGAQQSAYSGHAWVILRSLRNDITIFLHRHRTELEHHKLTAVKALSILKKEDGPFSVELDRQRRDCHDRHEHHQR